jgi:hypothetical protein
MATCHPLFPFLHEKFFAFVNETSRKARNHATSACLRDVICIAQRVVSFDQNLHYSQPYLLRFTYCYGLKHCRCPGIRPSRCLLFHPFLQACVSWSHHATPLPSTQQHRQNLCFSESVSSLMCSQKQQSSAWLRRKA